ncbi:MAG: hypothetical protein J6T94_00980 [Bacteroidaceae bacterium]|nr:hypothetical protein [Bacteroidaceae bacterium]
MKKFIITIIILGIIVGALIATCPDAQKHRDVVNSRIENAVTSYMQGDNKSQEGLGGIFSSALGSLVGKLNLASSMKVSDYGLFSLGSVETSDKKQVVSLGILNHVFCFISEDDIKDFIGDSAEKSGLF